MHRYPCFVKGLFLLLFVAWTTTTRTWVGAQEQQETPQLVELTDDNFDQVTKLAWMDGKYTTTTTSSWFILFKAERCPHCKTLMPELLQVAQEEVSTEMQFGVVDVPTNRATTIRFGIRGFPTMILLKENNLYRYKGRRNHEAILSFLRLDQNNYDTTLERIPPPPTAWSQAWSLITSIGLELWDMATGKSAGAAGIAVVILLLFCMGLFSSLIAMFFMPAQEEDKNNNNKKQE